MLLTSALYTNCIYLQESAETVNPSDSGVSEAASPTGWRRAAAVLAAPFHWLAETAIVRGILRLNRAAQHRVDVLEEKQQQLLRRGVNEYVYTVQFPSDQFIAGHRTPRPGTDIY
jgi:hypothetical protein